MCSNVRFCAVVEDLEEGGNFLDRRRRVVNFGTQRVDEAGSITLNRLRYHQQAKNLPVRKTNQLDGELF